MDCCLLCLEHKKDLLDNIKANTTQWKELGISRVLEKHFWPLNSTQQPCYWICSSCWQEVDHFHKFYLRVEEAHINFGRVKIVVGNNILQSREEINEEIKDASYCLEPEILIDQNELPDIVNIKQEGDKNDINDYGTPSIDPLEKSTASQRRHIKNAQTKASATTKCEQNQVAHAIKKETNDSDDFEYASEDDDNDDDDDDNCSNEPDKNPTEYKNRKASDKFIAEHFKEMFCDICKAPFVNFIAMKKHFLLTHSNQKGYLVCCSRKFYQRSHLVDHIQCHLNPGHFKCSQCGKILSDRKNLQRHILREHKPADVVAKHSCDICGKSFTMAYLLRSHKLIHLPEEEKKFPCTHCGKFYASSNLLKIHTEVVHLKRQAKICYICGKTLGTSSDYKAHMNKHEGISTDINCDVCSLRLSCERSLKIHKESQHPVGGKKDHPCSFCDKVSPSARALKKHIITMHEKGFDHKCNMCEKAFRRPEALKEHIASHTGTPLYMCPWCPQTFNSNGNMHAHRKNKHPKEYLELKMQRYM